MPNQSEPSKVASSSIVPHVAAVTAAQIPISYKMHGPNGNLLEDKPSEGFLRMQAMLAQWLRMENVVVLLGAGASASQGGALLGSLEKDVLQAIVALCESDQILNQSKPLVEDRLRSTQSGSASYNFEKWLTFLTNAHCIATTPDSPITAFTLRGDTQPNPDALAHLIRRISQLVFLRCSLKLPSLLTAVSGHHSFFAKLVARDPALGRAQVFTTNYDTLVEQALEDLGIHYADGFVGRVRPRFDPASYGLDLYFPGDVTEGRVRRFDKFVHVYKPHGSINWRRPTNGPVVQHLDPRLAVWESWEATPTDERLAYIQSLFAQDGEPIGILPTENKFVQTLGMPYAHLFRAFHAHLQSPQTFLIVIGYSFGDPHVNAVIDDAMTNPSIVMLVVAPFVTDDLKRRIEIYQRTGERVFLLEGINAAGAPPHFATFDDFALKVLPQVKWIDDFRKLRQVERDLSTEPLKGVDSQ